MGKIKIHEIAKKLGLTSKEVLKRANELEIEVKSHLSGVTDDQANKIENSFGENNTKVEKNMSKKENKVEANEPKKEEKKETKQKKSDENKKENTKKAGATKKSNAEEEKAPVIIRREVIISDNEQAPKKEEKKTNPSKNNIGFVERKQNKDYNIVYRNKPNKPMTVNELFGIKSKKEEVVEKEVSEVKQEEIVKETPKVEEKTEEPVVKLTPKEEKEVKEEPKKVEKTEQNARNFENRPQNNRNYQDRNNRNYEGRNQRNYDNRDQRPRNYENRDGRGNNYQNNRNFDNRNRDNRNFENRERRPYNNNRDNQGQNGNFNRNNNNRFNNNKPGFGNNNGGRFNNGRRPLDEKGIEKNIKNIMQDAVPEKETVREYNKSIDKQKNNSKFDENRGAKKNKNKKGNSNSFDEGKLKTLKQSNRLSSMFDDDSDGSMLDYYDLSTQRNRKNKKKQKDEEKSKQKIFKLTEITIPETITVKDLAAELKKTASEVITKLMGYGIMATLNNDLDFDTAFLVAEEFGVKAIKKEVVTDEDILFDDSEDKEEDLVERPPVVVVMGHVDHGKTSLLDAVRKTNVIEGEAGGITQAIGAYKVKINDREITFLDTPGHEAFTAMRARGAQITDIAILVVAANDGVMPQTIEAINHAKSAGIPIIVAVNKIDLPDANIDKVKQELMTYELVPEEWGGDTIYVPISAKKGENIDQLLEMVLLQADVLELKANPNKQAKGAVIEARLDKAKGAIATMLVQRGKLDVGDTIVVGSSIGRIRAMKDDKGKKVKSAGPSTPVEIMGLTDVPQAGDIFYEVDDEKTAKHLIEKRKREEREKSINAATKVTLDNLFSQMEAGKLKQLNLIIKADVQGSVEAVKQSLGKLQNEEAKVKVIHAAAGAVNESDVTLAKVSNAIIIAFNVRPNPAAKEIADRDEVEIKQYSIIYQAIEDVEAALKGMLAPKFEEKLIGTAEIRETFRISNVGTIAGCFVLTGKLERNAGVRIIRDNVVIHEGHLATLKRFKDDAKEVSKGFECGAQIQDYNDIKVGDVIEAFIMEEIKR
ncbi:MAG: translation initiation factor IF-2 [Clostridia bacterium]|nr:translation initiation factor IF-2 [Clostridia bacterium]